MNGGTVGDWVEAEPFSSRCGVQERGGAGP